MIQVSFSKLKWVFLFILIFDLLFCCVSFPSPVKGRVIDAKTKQPISGAAVLIRQRHGTIIEVSTNIVDVQDSFTDENGEFNIRPRTLFYSSLNMPPPDVYIYKPGYGSYPTYRVSPYEMNYNMIFLDGVTVELPKSEYRQERLAPLMEAEEAVNGWREKAPYFSKLIEDERKALGVKKRINDSDLRVELVTAKGKKYIINTPYRPVITDDIEQLINESETTPEIHTVGDRQIRFMDGLFKLDENKSEYEGQKEFFERHKAAFGFGQNMPIHMNNCDTNSQHKVTRIFWPERD